MKPNRTNRSIKKHRPKSQTRYAGSIPNRLAPGSAQSQKMQNEPNLTNTQRLKNEKRSQFYDQSTDQTSKRCQFYYQIFLKNYQILLRSAQENTKNAKKCATFETNTLNSMYNKDLHKYSHPLINSSTHPPILSFTQLFKTNPISPLMRPKAESTTQYDMRNTTYEKKTNPICKQTTISTYVTKTYIRT